MSLSEQVQRVDGGQNAALKKIIEKLGGTVPDTTKIDGYAALVEALKVYTADQQLSSTTKTAYDLGSDAVPDDVLEKLSNATLYENGSMITPTGESINLFVTGTYVGNQSDFQDISLGFQPSCVLVVKQGSDFGLLNYSRTIRAALILKNYAAVDDSNNIAGSIGSNGFTVYSSGNTQLNDSPYRYHYIAFV